MREPHTCDFYGTNAVGVPEVLPPVLTPADDQRHVALCEHCERTLSEVIAPLLSRLGVDAGVDVANDAQAEAGASATSERATSRSSGEAASVDVNAVDPVPTPPGLADHDSSDEDDNAGSPGDHANDSNDVDDEAEVETEAEAGTKTKSEPSVSTADEQPRPDDESGRGEEPPKFRGVIRILQDREFPVERAKVEALASGVCDLDDDKVADILDYVIERRLLVDGSGALRWP